MSAIDTSGFGARLRAAREEEGLSQDGLGRLASCTDRTVGHYEAGRRQPTATILLRLARALDTTIEYLLTGEGSR